MEHANIDSLTWAFSPCPNDTFIFGALAMGLLPNVRPIKPLLEDIDTLNDLAAQGNADIIKISAAAYPALCERYQVLPCGGAMGEGVGPLLVRRGEDAQAVSADSVVAHPGTHTTAFALFKLFHPEVTQFRELLFSDIEHAVRRGDVTHGLLIHEGRFTYQAHRLFSEEDLGNRWEQDYSLPLPLGVILVRRTLSDAIKRSVRQFIAESIEFAWAQAEKVMPYVAAHAQEMESSVQQKHINLYVNSYSKTIGPKGELALRTLWRAVSRENREIGEEAFFRG